MFVTIPQTSDSAEVPREPQAKAETNACYGDGSMACTHSQSKNTQASAAKGERVDSAGVYCKHMPAAKRHHIKAQRESAQIRLI